MHDRCHSRDQFAQDLHQSRLKLVMDTMDFLDERPRAGGTGR